MHAVKFERALKTSASHRLDAILVRPGQIDQADRQTGQKDERLRTVREAEVPRSPIFERVAWNVIDKDRNQHGSAPKVDVADAVCFHFNRLGAKTAPLLDRFKRWERGLCDGLKRSRRTVWPYVWRYSVRSYAQPFTFMTSARCSPGIDRKALLARGSAGLDQPGGLVALEQVEQQPQAAARSRPRAARRV